MIEIIVRPRLPLPEVGFAAEIGLLDEFKI